MLRILFYSVLHTISWCMKVVFRLIGINLVKYSLDGLTAKLCRIVGIIGMIGLIRVVKINIGQQLTSSGRPLQSIINN